LPPRPAARGGQGEAGEAGDNGRAPLWIQTVTDFPVVDESPI